LNELLGRFTLKRPQRQSTRRLDNLADNAEAQILIEAYVVWLRGFQVAGMSAGVRPIKDGLKDCSPEALSLRRGVYADNHHVPMRVFGICDVKWVKKLENREEAPSRLLTEII